MTTKVADRLRAWTRPSGPLPRLTTRGQVFDVLLALAVGIGAVYYVLDNMMGVVDGPMAMPFQLRVDQEDWTLLFFLAGVSSAALVFRRRYPLAMLWVVLFAIIATPKDAARLTFYAGVLAAYSAGAYSPYRAPTLASLVTVVITVSLVTDDTALPTVPTQYVPLWIMVPILIAAYGVRTWKLRTEEGQARVLALQRDQAEAERRAVEGERARIARELHDVVTHNVSVMVIQAGAARKVMDSQPDQAREALLAVEASGRATMSELRHVMGLLTMDADGPDLAPQPGLGELEALVARVRDTGLPVGLTVVGERRSLPPGVELAAYRVAQEALTNTVKHASGASATVTVDYGVDLLRVEVTDTGGTPDAAAATGNGRGLIGLRERLSVYGATLHSGPRLLGGYRVTALIPLETT